MIYFYSIHFIVIFSYLLIILFIDNLLIILKFSLSIRTIVCNYII